MQKKRKGYKIITAVSIFIWIFSGWPQINLEIVGTTVEFPPAVHSAFAAEYLVNDTLPVVDNGSPGPKQVWTSHTDGYIFYLNETNNITMASTTDGGLTWSAERQVDSQNTTDAIDVAVWWGGWTSDSYAEYIHIATLETGLDDVYYTRLDLATGSFSTPALGTNQSATVTAGTSYAGITMAEDGVLYMTVLDNNDSWVVSCSTTCTNAGNWSERANAYGTTPDLRGNSAALLSPVGGTNNVLLMYFDTTSDTLDYNIYSATSSSWWFTATQSFGTGKEGNQTFEGDLVGLAYDSVRKATYISFGQDVNDFSTEDHDVEVWKYTEAAGWQQRTNPATDVSGGIQAAKMGINIENGYLYVVYTRRSTIGLSSTSGLYYRVSYDDGVTWSAESSALNSETMDLRYSSVSSMSRFKFGVSWKYTSAPNEEDLYFAPINAWYQVRRNILLFEGYTLKLPSGRMIIHQQ